LLLVDAHRWRLTSCSATIWASSGNEGDFIPSKASVSDGFNHLARFTSDKAKPFALMAVMGCRNFSCASRSAPFGYCSRCSLRRLRITSLFWALLLGLCLLLLVVDLLSWLLH
jgi:hypothetical protein